MVLFLFSKTNERHIIHMHSKRRGREEEKKRRDPTHSRFLKRRKNERSFFTPKSPPPSCICLLVFRQFWVQPHSEERYQTPLERHSQPRVNEKRKRNIRCIRDHRKKQIRKKGYEREEEEGKRENGDT
mmetsp:Transcript_33897/g.48147  ORF Transcript_33897/g.48147 Transcript_33897/m.48147 type:complete len:128 (-) Transcript_33897:573-956(-)